MSETLQIINIIVLALMTGLAITAIVRNERARKKKKADDQAERERWERGVEIARHDKEYMAFVNDITGLGKEYDPHPSHSSDLRSPQEKGQFRLYVEEEDSQIRHFRRGNFITSHSDDTNRSGESYDNSQWRFTMPHAAVDLLIECFTGDETKAYQIKRAIELSIEHYAIEMADDAECLRIIEERFVTNQ